MGKARISAESILRGTLGPLLTTVLELLAARDIMPRIIARSSGSAGKSMGQRLRYTRHDMNKTQYT